MFASSSLIKKTGTRDAVAALDILADILSRHATFTPATTVHITVYPTNPTPIAITLAQRLPPDTPGFLGGKITVRPGLAARDFLTRASKWKKAGFAGSLPNFTPAAALDLIRDISANHDARLYISVKNIRWHGDTESWSGALKLDGTPKTAREYILEFIARSAAVSGPKDALSTWKNIRTATGIDFARGKIQITDPAAPVLPHSPDPATQNAISIRFNEAIATARTQLARAGLTFESVPHVKHTLEARMDRMSQALAGPATPISFFPAVKAFFKTYLPEFSLREVESEALRYFKNLTPVTDLILRVDKIHMHGLGKTFTLLVGVEFPHAPWRGRTTDIPLFRLLGCIGDRVWTYQTKDDLHAVLTAAAALIRQIIPILAPALTYYLAEIPRDLPADLPAHPALSAKEAFALAQPLALAWRPTATLVSIRGHSLSPDGRLGGAWAFDFRDSSDTAHWCRAQIPHVGQLTLLRQYDFSFLMPFKPIVHWIDSPQAVSLATQAAAAQLGPIVMINASIDHPGDSDLRWRLDFYPSGSDNPTLVYLRLSDGDMITINPSK